jgi:hypothetical protein
MGAVAERAVQRGVSPDRIVRGGDFVVPERLFTPEGPTLDIAALRAEAKADPQFSDLIWGNLAADRPCFGLYGKLGERKGSFALLAAMHRLMSAGVDVGLSCSRTARLPYKRISARGSTDSALQTASSKSRSFLIGVSPNSCEAVWPSAASSRDSRSHSTHP